MESLSDKGPMSGITMRAIAEEAGTSLGLAYEYFTTKDEMLGAVLDRAAKYITEGLGPEDPPGRLAQQAWERMADRPVFGRLVGWLVLERRDLTQIMAGHPFLQVVAQQAARANDKDPKAAAAALGIVVLGGGLLAPALNVAAGKQADDNAVYERLMEA
ncbi:MAG: TetR/AcrR family transcriptional regulator, partial [Acidimicrobiia bacterium]